MRDLLMFMIDTFVTVKVCIALTISLLTLAFVILPGLFIFLKWKYTKTKRNNLKIAFFHPYCNAGGGGEKVLWKALQCLQKQYPNCEFYVYTGDIEVTPTEILDKVNKNLNVKIDAKKVQFVYLNKRRWIEASKYPYFTLLGQSLGSVYLAFEALNQLNPDIFIETTGFAFTLPLFKHLAGCKTASYVHYPTITKDMLKRVSNRQSIYNNRNVIARSPFLTSGKLLYYRFFAWLYSLCGQCSDITMVNSTFTMDHLTEMWSRPLYLVYPPCDVNHLVKMDRPKERQNNDNIRILSLSQFRPEKDHPLQLQSMYELRELVSESVFNRLKLVLIGSCRNTDDKNRVKDLQDLAKHLSLENNVEFRINVSYDELLEEFRAAHMGIHTMLDEHFGIGVVELMAAGLITIAHKSGGPLLDIIETSEASRLGFLASTPYEYAHSMLFVLSMSSDEVQEIRVRAQASVERFSSSKFQQEFLRAVEPLFKNA